MFLHSHYFQSPLSNNQEVSCFGDGRDSKDSGDDGNLSLNSELAAITVLLQEIIGKWSAVLTTGEGMIPLGLNIPLLKSKCNKRTSMICHDTVIDICIVLVILMGGLLLVRGRFLVTLHQPDKTCGKPW